VIIAGADYEYLTERKRPISDGTVFKERGECAMKNILLFCALFILLLSHHTSATTTESDVQTAYPRHSSDKKEVVAKTVGFSDENFEIVDGNVVIKKSIAETIARKLLGADDIEVTLIPWFEAELARSGQNGKIANITIFVKESMLKIKYPTAVEEFLLLHIISPETGEFLKYPATYSELNDGKCWLIPAPISAAYPGPDDSPFELHVFIRDGGSFDLDKTENGSIVGQLAIVGKEKLKEGPTDPIPNPISGENNNSSGGCNAGYDSILMLLGSVVLLIRKTK